MVTSDPDLLRQVFHNLIGNAVRHGWKKVQLSATRSSAGNRVVVCISNFFGAENSWHIGAGMGLRLVKAILGALGTIPFRIKKNTRVFSIRLSMPHVIADP